MIKINFKVPAEEPSLSQWTRWRRKCCEKTEELIGAVHRGDEWDVEDSLYKETKDIYYDQFHGKCAYCEKKIEKPYESQLDHFRPKKKVTVADDTAVIIVDHNGIKEHPGYYWLAYDWQNLLLSCERCNKPNNENENKLGKRNRFPLSDGSYATIMGDEENERPLLINPLTENPKLEIAYNSENGELEPVDNSERGAVCINIFGLSIRQDLIDGRIDAYDETLKLLSKWAFLKGEIAKSIDDHEKILLKHQVDKLKGEIDDISVGKFAFSLARQTAISDMKKLYEGQDNIN